MFDKFEPLAMNTIEIYLESKRRVVNKVLDKYLPLDKTSPLAIHKAMRYSVLNGGKRLRAILALMTGEMLNVPNSKIMPYACSLELVHAYSLVHDDLPAMDNDDFRRGKPTCHKAFGEAMAILAGDALLTYAFQLTADRIQDKKIIPSLISELSKAAGSQGMVGGQALDIRNDFVQKFNSLKVQQLNNLNELHLMKTGAMIIVSARGAAIIGGAHQKELSAVTSYARNFGLAFQIVDDILDVSGSKAILGKTPGKDAKLNKLTYVSLKGIDESKAEAARLMSAARKSLRIFGSKAQRLNELADYILVRNA